MKNLNEYMSREDLIILNENEKIDTYLSINSSKRKNCNCYVVDNRNRYIGKISESYVLDFISSSLIIMSESSSDQVMDRVRNIGIKELIELESVTLSGDSSFSDMLLTLNSSEQAALAVLDRNGCILGEVSVHSVMNKLNKRNALHRMPVKAAG